MTKKEEFMKMVAPQVEALAELCREHQIPFVFLAQIDDKEEDTPCELSLSSDLYYKGVSIKLCNIHDDITGSFKKEEAIVPKKDKKLLN